MKIIFTTIPMKKNLTPLKYPVNGNISLTYEKEVIFPVSAVMAKLIKKNEKVKVVCLLNSTENSDDNYAKFQQEINKINIDIGATISWVNISEPFTELKENHENRFKKLINELEEKSEIITDITYGQKTLPILLFTVLNFAEKFFNAEILNIIYGKVEFDSDNKIKQGSEIIYDLTSLYYLNTLTIAMEAKDGKKAIKMIDDFFTL